MMTTTTFTDLHTDLVNKVEHTIQMIVEKFGTESPRTIGLKAIPMVEEYQFKVYDGHGYVDYITELCKGGFRSQNGYNYAFDAIGFNELCSLVDFLCDEFGCTIEITSNGALLVSVVGC